MESVRTALAVLALLLAGCRTRHTSLAADVDPSEWADTVEIVLPNTDTLTRCDLSLYLRFDERFRDDSLTLHVEVRTPDSLSYEAPFLFCVPHLRKPAAVRSEAVADYRKRVRLAREGDYRVLIVPARPVTGVEAVGLYVERD